MAVNRYDNPAQAQFINTYVPIPFEEMLQAGLTKQQGYNTGLAGVEQARAEAEAIKYIQNSIDEKYVREYVIPTFANIADEYATQDYGDKNVVRTINSKINSSIDRERVRRIGESYQNYSEYTKDLRKLGLEGKNAPYLNQFNPTNFSSEYDIFNQTPEAAVNYHDEAENYFNQMKDSLLSRDPKTGQIVSGVNEATITRAAQANLSEFMGSTAGRQAVMDFRYRGDTRSDSEIAYDVLLSAGNEFIRKNIDYMPQYAYDAANPPTPPIKKEGYAPSISLVGQGKRGEIKDNTRTIESMIPGLSTSYVDKKTGKEVTTSERYKEWQSTAHNKIINAMFKGAVSLGIPGLQEKMPNLLYEPPKSFKEVIDVPKDKQAQSDFGALSARTESYYGKAFTNASADEQIEMMNSYLKEYDTRTIEPNVIEIDSDAESKYINDKLFGTVEGKGSRAASDRSFYFPNQSSGDKKNDFKKVTELYPMNEYEYKASAKLSPQNPIYPSGYVVDIYKKDANGNPISLENSIYMSGDLNENEANTLEYDLYNALNTNPTGVINVTDKKTGLQIIGFASGNKPGNHTGTNVNLEVWDGATLVGQLPAFNNSGVTTNQVIDGLDDIYNSYLENKRK